MKSITFLFPGNGRKPIGGYKVVYEYANRLSKDGYIVHIVYPATVFFRKKPFMQKIRCILKYIYFILLGGYSGRRWFQLNSPVREHFTWSLNEHSTPKTDYYVATAVETAIYLKEYNIPIQKKLYLIQHYENWSIPEPLLRETYRFGFKNIAIARWLQKIVEETGAPCYLIQNGFDFNFFQKTIDYPQKDKFLISMLYHSSEWKGCKYGLEALHIVKQKFPQLKVYLFGVPDAPSLPDWIEYYQQPDRETFNRIYNEAAIYLGPSLSEGWGLTVGEAMICGAAVVCTNNPGYWEMAIDKQTALVAPIKDAESLANNIIYLIENDGERYRIAAAGHQYIQQFTWDIAYKKFVSVLNDSKK